MINIEHIIVNANQAVAQIAYKTNEVFPIYPITPSSEMAELVEEWSANQQKNIFDNVPTAFEMQSEAGVAGAMHGALQTGSLSATFTASQGLLLMLTNMHKIAGELTPNVIHVATRAVASHALSVFGDHSDVMSARNTGYAMLASGSVQEAQDFALIAQSATLESRIPFLHFFDGFRTSHEVSKIEKVNDDVIRAMINDDFVQEHRNRALNPNNPHISGTAQGPDVFFQSREAVNPYYTNCPLIVQQKMDEFYQLTGRAYKVFEYIGHPEAEHIIVVMASATETMEDTISHLNGRGDKIGLVKVRLFRPFNTDLLLESIPKTCKSIAVLDRTKEAGSSGEPLYLDVVQAVFQSEHFYKTPKVVGGRYGLASKEFTPAMVSGIAYQLKNEVLKNPFTVGIQDDVSHLSIAESDYKLSFQGEEILFYEYKKKQTQKYFQNFINRIGERHSDFLQGYQEIDYKKSSSKVISNIRYSDNTIKAPYLISEADFVGYEDLSLLIDSGEPLRVKQNGVVLVQSNLTPSDFWSKIPNELRDSLYIKGVELYIVDPNEISKNTSFHFNLLQECYLILAQQDEELVRKDLSSQIKKVEKHQLTDTNGVRNNFKDTLSNTLLGLLLQNKGNTIPVSQLPVDGVCPTNTSLHNKRKRVGELPIWNANACTQCGACSMACSSGALRIKVYDDNVKSNAPKHWQSSESKIEIPNVNHLTLQINPDQCTACNSCVDICSENALELRKRDSVLEKEQMSWNYFEQIPELDRKEINVNQIDQQQLQEPLFKYAMGVDGCGEAPYLKLMSQLFGDSMLVANATGASSIFGGALPTTPWSKDKNGRGPAWSNSLFEDNAEYGLGFRLSIEQQQQEAKSLLQKMAHYFDEVFLDELLKSNQTSDREIELQRSRVDKLKSKLKTIVSPDARELMQIADSLIKKGVWIVGGDGWAYDIGFGGVDHVLASGKNVNLLVLDNEVYSNTGGQMSKATPYGAKARFAAKGKLKQKKDLGLLAMQYDNVYVASVAIGSDQEQTLKAFLEAEQHDGPSIIIAYCHSPEHGIDMKHPSKYHKAAVASGQWLLYRNNPARKTPLVLDSPAPSIPIEAYLDMEKRFNPITKDNYKHLKLAQNFVDERFLKYQRMTGLSLAKVY